MRIDRRNILLGGAGAAVAGVGAAIVISGRAETPSPPSPTAGDWARVRSQFQLAADRVDMSAMLIAAHPNAVREAIARHRDALDTAPIEYLERHNREFQNESRRRAGEYLDVHMRDIALTDSTTMGAGLVYHGLNVRPDQEMLTTDQDYYITHESLRLAAARRGASLRRIPLYDDAAGATADGLTHAVVSQVQPQTRVVALTWVHSSTGIKLPIPAIAAEISHLNRSRDENDRVLLCVDGVHGFGCQDVDFADLGCDFFFAGCHKWLFGPRGTGVVVGSTAGWAAIAPTIPTFLDRAAYDQWISGEAAQDCNGARFSPGGFKAFEHLWALADAFLLHKQIGRSQVAARTAELADQLKQGLAAMPHVTLHTPRSRDLSAGIVSFDVDGLTADQVVGRLRAWRVIGSAAPYARSHARLTPSIRNSPEEIDFALQAVQAMGSGGARISRSPPPLSPT